MNTEMCRNLSQADPNLCSRPCFAQKICPTTCQTCRKYTCIYRACPHIHCMKLIKIPLYTMSIYLEHFCTVQRCFNVEFCMVTKSAIGFKRNFHDVETSRWNFDDSVLRRKEIVRFMWVRRVAIVAELNLHKLLPWVMHLFCNVATFVYIIECLLFIYGRFKNHSLNPLRILGHVIFLNNI